MKQTEKYIKALKAAFPSTLPIMTGFGFLGLSYGIYMSISQQIITIAMCVLGTMLTRFTPFFVFSENKTTPKYIQYLGKALPSAGGTIFYMILVQFVF